jgi:hypothetical protein
MTDHPNDKPRQLPYDIGYGKPPANRQFVKGKSGNPRGRPKKGGSKRPASKPHVDSATRDRFLKAARRPVKIREGDSILEIPVVEAVMRAESVAAMKGNPHAIKNFLEREERYNKDLTAEIEESNEIWRKYSENYERMISQGIIAAKDWPHPEALIFEEGCFVIVPDPVALAKCSEHNAQFRDLLLLLAERDRRRFPSEHRLPKPPIFLSEVLAQVLNMKLPKRFQLDESQLFWRVMDNQKLKMRAINDRLEKEGPRCGIPGAPDYISPVLKPDALAILRDSQ